MTTYEIDRTGLFHAIGYKPHPGQKEIHQSDAPRRVVACGVRFGKTKAAAMEAVAAAMQPQRKGSVGWIVAPSYDLSNRVFREIVHAFLDSSLKKNVILHSEHRHLLRVVNMAGGVSEIVGKSGDSPVSLLGEGLDWLIVDEASRLKPEIWERYLSARLVDKDGWALLISTPKGKNYFYDLHRRGQPGALHDPGFESWNYPSWTNPRLRKGALDETKRRIPEAIWNQEYGAQFIEGAGQVFRNVRDRATGHWIEPIEGARYYAGVDLAKTTDFTVVCILDAGNRLVATDRFHRIDWALQIPRVGVMLAKYHNPLTYVDSTGMGEPIFEMMLAAGIKCAGYPFTASSKAALVNNLALMFETERITIPTPEVWPEGIEELESFVYSISPHGNMRTDAPPGMHDDICCSLMLAAWGARNKSDFKVQFV